MTKTLVKSLCSRLESDKDSYRFVKSLMDHYELYLFGGGVRDFLNNDLNCFRDLDFVIKSKNDIEIDIEKFIPDYIQSKKNRFNGYKIYFKNCIIDIWDINNTWAFKNNKLENTVENLLNSVYLNIDSLLYNLNENKYINDCDEKYQRIRQLDILYTETPFENLNLLRAIIYKKKYSLEFSNKLKKTLYNYTQNNCHILEEFMSLQKEHYSYYVLDKQELKQELNCLSS